MMFWASSFSTIILLSVCNLCTSEPILDWRRAANLAAGFDIVSRADTNWTTQAYQTHCDNINYNDFTECCTIKSGSGWRSCNDAGSWTLSGSTVICYNLDAGHDCCSDDSVCDVGLGCCGGTCCQNTTSVTVCEDGCVSKNGLGCVSPGYGAKGTCAHGISSSSTSSSTASTATQTKSTTKASSTPTSTPDSTTTSSPSATASSSAKSGLSTGGIIGIAIPLAALVVSAIGILVRIFIFRKKQQDKKRKEAQQQTETSFRTNSFPPSSPASPPPIYPTRSPAPYQTDANYPPWENGLNAKRW